MSARDLPGYSESMHEGLSLLFGQRFALYEEIRNVGASIFAAGSCTAIDIAHQAFEYLTDFWRGIGCTKDGLVRSAGVVPKQYLQCWTTCGERRRRTSRLLCG